MKHYFDIEIAEKYGIEEAIILEQIAYWIRHNEQNGTNFHDGLYWMYNSIPAFKKQYPYMSERKIRRVLKKLESDGVISTGNYNKKGFDRTKWYTINLEMKSTGDLLIDSCGQNGHIEPAKVDGCSGQSGQMDAAKVDRPIPLVNQLEENINNSPIVDEKVKSKRSGVSNAAQEHFLKCWSMFPRKEGKGSVKDEAKRQLLRVPIEEFEKVMEKFKKAKDGVEKRFIKTGGVYFNQEGWRDYFDPDDKVEATGNMPQTVAEISTPEMSKWLEEINFSAVKFAKRYGKTGMEVSLQIKQELERLRLEKMDMVIGG